jgi:dTDP-4-dehydrorhamnose 3,5-epimerase
MAFNETKGTLRGLHYHAPEFAQVRVIRCAAAGAFVAAVDLRPASPTFLKTLTLTLDSGNQWALYAPPGVAIGYQTLADRTIVHYQMAEFYDPRFEMGVRWDDPAFGIDWPDSRPTMNERDAGYPDFRW